MCSGIIRATLISNKNENNIFFNTYMTDMMYLFDNKIGLNLIFINFLCNQCL
jgi:hypothetical protein